MRILTVVGLMITALGACQRAPIQPEQQPPSASVSAPVSASVSAPLPAVVAPPSDPARRYVDGVAWSKSGRSLATWCSHNCLSAGDKDAGQSDAPCPVSVWDRARGAVQATFETPCAHDIFSVRWSTSEALFGVSDYDSVRVWRVADRSKLIESGAIAMYGAFRFSPDESMLLWGNVFGQVELWALPKGKLIKGVSLHNGAASLGWSAQWDAASKLLLLSVEHGEPELWNGRALTKIKALRLPAVKEPDDTVELWGADDKSVVVVGTNGLVAVVQAPSGAAKVIRKSTRKPDEPMMSHVSAELSADKGTLVVMDALGGVEAIDLAAGKRREILPKTEVNSYRHRVSLAPDGRHLALGREEGVALASLDKPGVARAVTLPARDAADAGDPGEASFLAWRSDGGLLIQRGEMVYGVSAEGTVEYAISAKGSPAVSPDGRFLAVADRDLTVIRLSDRRAVTFELRDMGSGLVAKAVDKDKKAVSEGDLTAFWAP